MMATGLLNHLWQSTLVAGLAWLVTLALRRDRASIRYRVWLAASMKFFVPFSVVTALGQRFGWRPVVVASVTPHEVIVEASGSSLSERAVRIVAHQPPVSSLLRTTGSVLPDLLIVLWAVGVMALLAMWIIRWRRVSLIIQTSTPLTNGGVVESSGNRMCKRHLPVGILQ